jgi:hypothetical protein
MAPKHGKITTPEKKNASPRQAKPFSVTPSIPPRGPFLSLPFADGKNRQKAGTCKRETQKTNTTTELTRLTIDMDKDVLFYLLAHTH